MADENCPASVIAALRLAVHDVASIWESARGSPDDFVLARAQIERRVVVTFDKDFGELAFRASLPSSNGVLLFRIAAADAATLAKRVLDVLASQDSWEGMFASIDEERVRIRKLPSSSC